MKISWINIFLTFLFLFTLAKPGYGQELLFHKNRIREVFYKKGDVITFRVAGEKFKITAEIKGFADSLIVFRDFTINPREITHLYFDSKTRGWFILRMKYSRLLIVAGAGYGLLDILNSGEVDKKTTIISGSMLAAGILTGLFIPRYFKIRGKRKLIIINNHEIQGTNARSPSRF